MNIEALINKYNVPGPRYTSYPTVPYWKDKIIDTEKWLASVCETYDNSKETGISIYIHLPFCENLCTFCGCHKHITRRHSVEEDYIQLVLKEWKIYVNALSTKPLIKEIHLGGGTPTFFSPENLKILLDGILKHSTLSENAELGFEGHPNNTTKEHLKTLYALSFRRVSYGVQDYNPKIQKAINRIQPFENVEKVHDLAKKIGYTSISHDLVFGLPHQNMDHISESIRLTNLLKPDRISLYSYAHVPWIKGVGQRGFKDEDIPKGDEKRALYELSKKLLLQNGYHEIGMDHFALESDSLYDAYVNKRLHRNFMGYTTNTTSLMIGLGMSSISDSWGAFAQNVKSVKEYTALVNENNLPVFRGHFLSEDDLFIRKHILNLMCHFSTDIDAEFRNHHFFKSILKKLDPLQQDGLIEFSSSQINVTELGRIFIRNICMCFDIYLDNKLKSQNTFSKTI
ncbi:MAG: oxygen-independent coproporphyrinogen III oxidase [Crocinitomicaceae bacterium]|nr:oxygen-independent coproporphyrinogen III oxidase [Crocinitomicaceae bacterium]